MATELSMNGKKKIETIQKEFSVKFPYLTLIFLDKERIILDVAKTLAEVRQSKGEDVSIVASLKVNTLEKKFLTNYGLIVEVAYQKDGLVVMTDPDEQKTLNELNSWCEANGCNKIDYKKNKEIAFSEVFIDKAIAENNAHEDGFDIDFNELNIGDQIWMDSNLDVSNFSNGDPIFEAKSPDEWIKANKDKKPAFCHYKFDSINQANYSKYYNWYAVTDKRGLAPNGWEIPTIESFDQLFKAFDTKTKLESGEDFSTWDGIISPALKSTEIWEYEEPTNDDPDATGTNTSGFNMLGLGFVDNVGIFQLFMEQTYLWVYNSINENEHKSVIFDMSYTGILLGMKTDINNGCQIRCIKQKEKKHEKNDLKLKVEFNKDFYECVEAIDLLKNYKDELIGYDIVIEYEDIVVDLIMNADLELEDGEIVEGQIQGISNERIKIEIFINENIYDDLLNLLQQSLVILTKISDISLIATDWDLDMNFYELDSTFITNDGECINIDDFNNVTEGDIDTDIVENGFIVGTPPIVFFNKKTSKEKNTSNSAEKNDNNKEIIESEMDPVLRIVKNKLLEYNTEIIAIPNFYKKSISFKLPFISNDDMSVLTISEYQGNYQMQFQCFDSSLVKELLAYKPDVIKKYASGVSKDDLCKNEGELLSAVVDFICLLSRKNLDYGDGTKIHYVGYNKYSKEINGVGQFQVFTGKEADVFSIYDNQEIGTQKWMTRNLQTSFFKNGELIKEAKTEAQWLLAAENQTPAWCYYNNDPANGSKYGYLYNWYAINDPSGLAPKGWEIPNQQDYLTFLENLKSRNSGVDFNLTPAGYRLQDSTFNLINQVGFWWTKDEKDENARFASFAIDKPELIFGDGLKSLGLSVICIAESPISQGLKELIDEGIAINLYRNPGMYKDDIYYSESDLHSNIKTYGSMFLDHLFAIPFKSYNKEVVDKVFKFLDKQIIVDYKDSMFRASMHHPAIGIYNSKTNELLGIGIGRKNRIFINSTDKTINDQNYNIFSKFDHSNVISTIVNLLTIAADSQISIMEAIDDGDSESEAEYSDSLDEAIENLLIAYPNLSNSIGDLSPGDF